MENLVGRVMNVESNGCLITRGRILAVEGRWVTVKECTGLTHEWPIGEVYQLVEC